MNTKPAPRSILVIDDNEDFRDLLMALFNNKNLQTIAVESGEHAIELLKTHRFQLIFCDFVMPTMSGHDIFLELKKAQHQCPFLLFTSADRDRIPEFEAPPEFLGIFLKTDPSKMIDFVHGKLPSSM